MKTALAPSESLNVLPYLNAEDVCDSIIYVLSTPPNVQVKKKFFVLSIFKFQKYFFFFEKLIRPGKKFFL